MVISPHVLVVQKQAALLLWMFDENLFLLDAPLENYVLLHEHMRALDWFSKTSTPPAPGKK